MEKNRTARELAEIRMDDTRITVYNAIHRYKEELCKHLMAYYEGELAVYVKSSEADSTFRQPVHIHIDKENHVSIEEGGDDYFVGEDRLEIIIDELCAGRVYQNGKYSKRVGFLLAPLKKTPPKPFDHKLLPFDV